jgi:hypothetical protein
MPMRSAVPVVAVLLSCGATGWAQDVSGGEAPSLAGANSLFDMRAAAQVAAPPVMDAAPATPKPPFSQDTWSFQTYGTASFGDGANQGEVWTLHVGAGYFLRDGFSVNLEGVGAYIDMNPNDAAQGGQAAGGGLDLLLRWHFLRDRDWSLYADGGAGFLQSSQSFPADGTHFNFTPQAGFGGTLHLVDGLYLMGGTRWYHISNARIPHGAARNPGYDSIMFYAGLMILF